MDEENYFDELLNHLSSEQKDNLYNVLEDFKANNALRPKANELLYLMLRDIAES